MKTFSSICLVLLVSICLILRRTEAQIAAGSDLVAETCRTTLHKDLCEKVLRTDPSSKGADIQGLAGIALHAASKKSREIRKKISGFLARINDLRTVQALKDCAENYESAGQQISDSLGAVESKKYFDANTWVTAAMSDADSCEEGLKPGTSILSRDNELFSQLCSNVLAIVNKAGGRTN